MRRVVKARYQRRHKVTTNSNHKQPVFDNVVPWEFTTAEPDQAYVTDITYIWTQEGWLYLAVSIDLFSRRVVGWSMGSRMKAKLVTDALRMAIWQRQPSAGLIVHSDRGSQYASNVYRRLLQAYDLVGSMSRKRGLLGQRCRGELLRKLEERACAVAALPDPR